MSRWNIDTNHDERSDSAQIVLSLAGEQVAEWTVEGKHASDAMTQAMLAASEIDDMIERLKSRPLALDALREFLLREHMLKVA